jgi:hypothetical protein
MYELYLSVATFGGTIGLLGVILKILINMQKEIAYNKKDIKFIKYKINNLHSCVVNNQKKGGK